MAALAFGTSTKSGFMFSLTFFSFYGTDEYLLLHLYPSELVKLTLTFPNYALNLKRLVYVGDLRRYVYVVS